MKNKQVDSIDKYPQKDNRSNCIWYGLGPRLTQKAILKPTSMLLMKPMAAVCQQLVVFKYLHLISLKKSFHIKNLQAKQCSTE
ncbi:CLUMA_CG014596, isoform A [Clunio marinus]|uniref:CLUMA_CG014596, isoform A n=1 Tax=Clunio marinus TaxID=568069 RepID=A0A1J1IM78_9DIPT|nr:CLUMA_CG014596, isoform A [Clunio marinus]